MTSTLLRPGLLLLLALFASLLFTANSLNFRGRVRERKLRAAVCILGQLGRTEISSKLENLIKPNLNIVDMHVFVLLQGGQANFDTNVGSSECSIAPRSLEDARGHFARSGHPNFKVLAGSPPFQLMRHFNCHVFTFLPPPAGCSGLWARLLPRRITGITLSMPACGHNTRRSKGR